MARQQFEQGQTIYVKHGSNYHKAVVVTPDKARRQYGPGFTHYAGVRYVQPDGTVNTEREWDIINNRTHILTEEAHNGVQRGTQVAKRRRVIAECASFEREFAQYTDQAAIIAKALDAQADEAEDLALYLRGMFSLRGGYGRLTRDEVRQRRRDNAEAARMAAGELRAMGLEP